MALTRLTSQWKRISQEEAFVGRCGEVGDELGSAVVAARLVRDLMRLCLLMERRYPPYSKWLGSAFAGYSARGRTQPHSHRRPSPPPTGARASSILGRAYRTVGAMHNQLALTEPVDPATRPYHSRPFQVLHAERFAAALLARISDPALRALPQIGTVDQFVDSTDVLCRPELTRAATLAALVVPKR